MKLLLGFTGLILVSCGSPELHFLATGCVTVSLHGAVCPIVLPYQLSGLCGLSDLRPTAFEEASEEAGAAIAGGLLIKTLSVDLCTVPFFSGSAVIAFGATAEFCLELTWCCEGAALLFEGFP